MTQYKKEFPLPVAFAPDASHARARRGARRARPAAAPHRRDREVRARDVLLQRRRRGGGAGRDAACSCPARATCPPTTHKPQMSAAEVTDKLLRRARDAASSTSSSSTTRTPTWWATPACIEAAVAAVETVDACLGRVVRPWCCALGGVCLITADHGNSDHMIEPDGSPNTAHSTNLVPFMATVPGVRAARRRRCCDLAPTVARPARRAAPPEMTGVVPARARP